MKSNQIIFDVLSKEELGDLIGKSLEEVIKNNSQNNPPDQELLTREEACKLLKVDSSTLWRWTNQGKITAYGIYTIGGNFTLVGPSPKSARIYLQKLTGFLSCEKLLIWGVVLGIVFYDLF